MDEVIATLEKLQMSDAGSKIDLVTNDLPNLCGEELLGSNVALRSRYLLRYLSTYTGNGTLTETKKCRVITM